MEASVANLHHVEEELGKTVFHSNKKVVQLAGMLVGITFSEEEVLHAKKSLFPFNSS